MKEDILEQLVDGYFLRQPATFTKHNVKYKPKAEDIIDLDVVEKNRYYVSSDIDVMAIHLNKSGFERVSVINCKSWQDGFDLDFYYKNLAGDGNPNQKVGTGPAWKKFREIYHPVWAKAFREMIFKETQSYDFTYYIAVTKFKKNNYEKDFISSPFFLNNLSDNGKHDIKIKFLTLEGILLDIFKQGKSTTLENTEIGRFLQLIKAADLKILK